MPVRGSETTFVLGNSHMRTASEANGKKKAINYEDRKKQFPSLVVPVIASKIGLTKAIRSRNAHKVASQKASEDNHVTYVKHPTVPSGKERQSRGRKIVAGGVVLAGFAVYAGVQAIQNDVPANIVAAYTSFRGGDSGTTTTTTGDQTGGSEFEVGQSTAAGENQATVGQDETFVSGKGKNKITCIGALATVKLKKNEAPLSAMTRVGDLQFDQLKGPVAQQFYDDVIANQAAWGSETDPAKQFVFQPQCTIPQTAYISN